MEQDDNKFTLSYLNIKGEWRICHHI
jgi:hypothetical protein